MRFPSLSGPIEVNLPDRAAFERALRARFAERRGFALATLNLDHLVKLRRDRAFAQAYDAQDFITADGNPVVWLCRLSGRGASLLPGADCVVPVAALAREAGLAVALLGSTEESLEGAARSLEAAVPGLHIARRIAPPMGFDPKGEAAAALLRQLEAAGIGLCFLALGAPKQEILAAHGRTLAPSVGFVSIGAGLDFLAGQQRRAPLWVRRIALEWLWRLTNDPGRLFGRYLRSALILPGLVVRALAQRRRR